MGFWARLKNWLPAVGWGILISVLSTGAFSGEKTGSFILPLLRWLLPGAGPLLLEVLHTAIRKLAHFTEYFVFSLLLARALQGANRRWDVRWAVWALAIAAAYAAFDEFHQLFVPGRTASPWDALLDATSAGAAQVFMWLRRPSSPTQATTGAPEAKGLSKRGSPVVPGE